MADINGTESDDILVGTGGDDALSGGDGDDRLTGGSGNDRIDGGPGSDTAVFAGSRSAYAVLHRGDGSVEVTDQDSAANGDDGADLLWDIEWLAFADAVLGTDGGGDAPQPDPDPEPNPETDPDPDEDSELKPLPNVAVEVTLLGTGASPDGYSIGEEIDYSVRVELGGNSAPEGYREDLQLRLVDVLAPGLILTKSPTPGDVVLGSGISGVVVDLAATDSNGDGTPDRLTSLIDITSIDGSAASATYLELTLSARATDVPENEAGVRLWHWASGGFIEHAASQHDSELDVALVEPLLTMEQTAGVTQAAPGDSVTYTVRVSHETESSGTAYDIVIDVAFDSTEAPLLSLVGGSVSAPAGSVISSASGDGLFRVEIDELSLSDDPLEISFEAVVGDYGGSETVFLDSRVRLEYDSLAGDDAEIERDYDLETSTTITLAPDNDPGDDEDQGNSPDQDDGDPNGTGTGPRPDALELAILAFDAYNRGPEPGVANLGGTGASIGEYRFSTDSATLFPEIRANDAWFSGFYAATYEGPTKVVSYRGTDFFPNDVLFGWSTALGFHSLGTIDIFRAAVWYLFEGFQFDSNKDGTIGDGDETLFGVPSWVTNALSDAVTWLSSSDSLDAPVSAAIDAIYDIEAAKTVLHGVVDVTITKNQLQAAFAALIENQSFASIFREQLPSAFASLFGDGGLASALSGLIDPLSETNLMDGVLEEVDQWIRGVFGSLFTELLAAKVVDDLVGGLRSAVKTHLDETIDRAVAGLPPASTLEEGKEILKDALLGNMAAPVVDAILRPVFEAMQVPSNDIRDVIANLLFAPIQGTVLDHQFSQASLAQEYWELQGGDAVTTGHSLGGGLAGYVSLRNGTPSIGFDHMPFVLAAANAQGIDTDFSFFSALMDLTDFKLDAIDEWMDQLNFGSFAGISIDGEILEGVRDGTIGTIPALLAAAGGLYAKGPLKPLGDFLFDTSLAFAYWTPQAEANLEQREIDPRATVSALDAINLHDQYLRQKLAPKIRWATARGDRLSSY
jgi:hypothetical protein